jgi:hypothetical protein
MNNASIENPPAGSAAFVEKLQAMKLAAQDAITAAQEYQVKHYNKHRSPTPDYNIGDSVLLKRKHMHFDRTKPPRKFAAKQFGPYKIHKIIVPHHAYELELPKSLRLHPVFPATVLEPYNEPTLVPERPPVNPPPVFIHKNTEGEYYVDKLIERRKTGRKIEYLVKWKDYDSSDNSWESLKDLKHLDNSYFEDFETRNPQAFQ